jgi:putative ABC transport system ATP-binding protein
LVEKSIYLEDVCPLPLNVISAESQIWNCKCVFENGKYYRVEAISGQGKSTLLHLIYGLRNDYRGRLLLYEKEANTLNFDQWSILRQKILSIVFQDLRLFLNLSGRDNILLKTALAGTNATFNMDYFAEKLRINDKLDKPVSMLSYGERQRIALIRALAPPFEWLLLDEPFSHLDPDNIERANELITEVCRAQHAGIIITTLGYDYGLKVDMIYKL